MYSRSPPIGNPRAMRVTAIPIGLITFDRYNAVASPSIVGLVATITSNGAAAQAFEQFLDLKRVGADAVERRDRAVQNVVQAFELLGLLHRDQVARLFDDADLVLLPLDVAAN